MLCVVFGVVILGNDMESDQKCWKVSSGGSRVFLKGGTDCHSLVHFGGWILSHAVISDLISFVWYFYYCKQRMSF